MDFELQSGTMYINSKPFGEIKECEITESCIDDEKIISSIDFAKSSEMTFEITNFDWTTFFKAIGLKWFFHDIIHKRRGLISDCN